MRAKRARLGASDHPLDERRAVMRLRLANKLKERDAYLAAYAVYTAQQAEAARFWQHQQLLQRQHALAAAAREVLAARQRAADAQRAAEQRAIDADARNAAAAAAAAREVLRADAAAWAAIELARAHERIRQLSAQQESVTASPACRGSSACRDDVSSACRDDVVFGTAYDEDEDVRSYGGDDFEMASDCAGDVSATEAVPTERPPIPEALLELARVIGEATVRLDEADHLYGRKKLCSWLSENMGLSIKFEEKVVDAAKAASVGLHEYIYRITHDVWAFCADEQNWDESICPETEWSQAKYPSTLANTFAKGILYLRAARMPDLAARVQVLQAFTDFEELKRQVELFDAYSDKCDGEFKDPVAALRALGLSVDEATRIANGGRLSREEVKKLRRRVKKRGGLVVRVRAEITAPCLPIGVPSTLRPSLHTPPRARRRHVQAPRPPHRASSARTRRFLHRSCPSSTAVVCWSVRRPSRRLPLPPRNAAREVVTNLAQAWSILKKQAPRL